MAQHPAHGINSKIVAVTPILASSETLFPHSVLGKRPSHLNEFSD